jgi:L-2-hydroxyglutarate oxidase LhgO
METVDCVVIGAGVVGLGCARALALAGREVIVLEAEHEIGSHTSSRNSEVIHAGIYYPTGSLKAKLCVASRKALYPYCAEHGVNHRRIGKIIVASDEDQAKGLRKYWDQATANGVDDLRMLTRDELAALEPQVVSVAGFLSPSTGIIDSHGLMLAYLGEAEAKGAMLAVQSPVESGRVVDGGIELKVGGAAAMSVLARTVINAAGMRAQEVARTIEGIPAATIPETFYAIGHYYTLSGKTPFNRLIYPVARSNESWLGVHVTIDLGGRCKFGPDFKWIDNVDYTFDESRMQAFYDAIRHYYPGLQDGQLQPGYTGIRPKIHGPGTPAPDFLIQGRDAHGVRGLVNLYGVESPGLTSSLAIGEYVRDLLAA